MHGGGGGGEQEAGQKCCCCCCCDTMIVADLLQPLGTTPPEGKNCCRSFSSDGGEELVVNGNTAIVREYPSGSVQRRLKTDFAITNGFWCEFTRTGRDESRIEGVCLFGRKELVFIPDTDSYTYKVTLPFEVSYSFMFYFDRLLMQHFIFVILKKILVSKKKLAVKQSKKCQ
ncbi:unnamed protein product [Gongylonema pulchrum]|uniref:Uncharacterized protein n=1 Tax=Gongylonema pulchrum TaxID=637853 RepID=A0A183DM64_9BILA|nr:unnamed protein product [Gongylonema pulchrum]